MPRRQSCFIHNTSQGSSLKQRLNVILTNEFYRINIPPYPPLKTNTNRFYSLNQKRFAMNLPSPRSAPTSTISTPTSTPTSAPTSPSSAPTSAPTAAPSTPSCSCKTNQSISITSVDYVIGLISAYLARRESWR